MTHNLPFTDEEFVQVWRHPDGGWTDRNISDAELIEQASKCAPSCKCWRQRLLRILDDRVIHAEHRFGRRG